MFSFPRNSLPLFLVTFILLGGCRGCVENVVKEQIKNAQEKAKRDSVGGGQRIPGKKELQPVRPGDIFPQDPPGADPFADGDGEVKAFAIKGVYPSFGPLGGGNQIRMVGDLLTDRVAFYMGSQEVPTRYDNGDLIAIVPPSLQPGAVDLRFRLSATQTVTLKDGYSYQDPLQIQSVKPHKVSVKGGAKVLLAGSGFYPPLTVSVDGEPVYGYQIIDSGHLIAYLPPHKRGSASLSVTSVQGRATLENALHYVAQLTDIKVEPSYGVTRGGTHSTLFIEGLSLDPQLPDQGVTVRLGGKKATILAIDPMTHTVQIETPPGKGYADVIVETVDDSFVLSNGYLYSDSTQPLLVSLSPAEGSVVGGNRVYLRGGNFPIGKVVRPFFGAEEGSVVVQGENELEVVVPASSLPGSVTVALKDASGVLLSSLPQGYSYHEVGSVERLEESSAGELLLMGSHLDGVSSLYLGGVPAEIIRQSKRELVVKLPEHKAGNVDLLVNFADFPVIYPNAYRYEKAPEIWALQPARGGVAGGTYVRVYGQGFSQLDPDNLTVMLGGMPATNVRLVDGSTLEFVTPPRETPGVVELELLSSPGTPAEKRVSSRNGYLYFEPQRRVGGTSGDPINGALNVTVVDSSGLPIQGAYLFVSATEKKGEPLVTNARGEAIFSRLDWRGSVTISAYAPGYSMATFQSVDAENLTIILSPPVPPPQPNDGDPPTQPRLVYGSFHGTVTSSLKLSANGDFKSIDMAYVATTQPTLSAEGFDPGAGSLVAGMGNEYHVYSHIGEQAVVAICGHYDKETKQFLPLVMGIQRHLVLNEREDKEVNIDCNIPLNHHVRLKFSNTFYAPLGPTQNSAELHWYFASDGYFKSPTIGKSWGSIVDIPNQPVATDVIADLTYFVKGGSESLYDRPPYSYVKEQFSYPQGLVSMPPLVEIAQQIDPLPGTPLKNHLRFARGGVGSPDFWWITLLTSDGDTVWEVLLDGKETDLYLPTEIFRHKKQYDTDNLPLTSSRYELRILGGRGYKPISINHWNYQQRRFSNLNAYSLASWMVEVDDLNSN